MGVLAENLGELVRERKGLHVSDESRRLILDAGGRTNRPPLDDPLDCLKEFLDNTERGAERHAGLIYYGYEPRTPRDEFLAEDVAISLTLNSRASGRAVASVVQYGHTIRSAHIAREGP